MDRLADFLERSGGLVTVLSVCFASPSAHDNHGCRTLWQRAGVHRIECQLRAADTAAYRIGTGDRLRCDVTLMEVTLAARLMKEER